MSWLVKLIDELNYIITVLSYIGWPVLNNKFMNGIWRMEWINLLMEQWRPMCAAEAWMKWMTGAERRSGAKAKSINGIQWNWMKLIDCCAAEKSQPSPNQIIQSNQINFCFCWFDGWMNWAGMESMKQFSSFPFFVVGYARRRRHGAPRKEEDKTNQLNEQWSKGRRGSNSWKTNLILELNLVGMNSWPAPSKNFSSLSFFINNQSINQLNSNQKSLIWLMIEWNWFLLIEERKRRLFFD